MIKFTINDKRKFSMRDYNTDNFNLEVYLSAISIFEKELNDLKGIKSNIDDIYNDVLQRFKSYMSMEVFFFYP